MVKDVYSNTLKKGIHNIPKVRNSRLNLRWDAPQTEISIQSQETEPDCRNPHSCINESVVHISASYTASRPPLTHWSVSEIGRLQGQRLGVPRDGLFKVRVT